jgi:hypothetical protein
VVVEDDLYTKEMLVQDLTNLVEKLDVMDDKVERTERSYKKDL